MTLFILAVRGSGPPIFALFRLCRFSCIACRLCNRRHFSTYVTYCITCTLCNSYAIDDCISTSVIYCITCTVWNKIYIGETGRRLADRFREHLRDKEKNNIDASKPVARRFNLPNHSHHNMTICGLSLHHGNTESRKNLEQKLFLNWAHSLHTELMNASHSTNLFTNSCDHISTNGKAPLHSRINHNTPIYPVFALTKG